jgi:RNA polymerase sigma factor (sigma-70 family)
LAPVSDVHQQFHDLVDRHYKPLSGYVRFLTGSSSDDTDILHRAFLLAHAKLAAGDPFRGDPGAWLRGVARNLVYEWWRGKRQLPPKIVDHLRRLAEEAGDEESDVARDKRDALKLCLEKLNSPERELLQSRYEHGLRPAGIAEALRINVATVRVRLHRIRQALKGCVEKSLARGEES